MNSKAYLMSKDKKQKLVGIFALAILLFNFPLIGLFSDQGLIFSLPVLYVYVFCSWAVIILLTYLVNKAPKEHHAEGKDKKKGNRK